MDEGRILQGFHLGRGASQAVHPHSLESGNRFRMFCTDLSNQHIARDFLGIFIFVSSIV